MKDKGLGAYLTPVSRKENGIKTDWVEYEVKDINKIH